MFRFGIPLPKPILPNPKPNPYDDRSCDAFLFHKITVRNNLTRNMLSPTQK